MIVHIIIAATATTAALAFIADRIGAEIGRIAEDMQEYPSCDNCFGSDEPGICRYCTDGSCWIHKNEK